MSQGQPVPLEVAEPIAQELRDLLLYGCSRIEIAGSIRRRKAQVADIELVAMPLSGEREAGDLWGSTEQVDVLDELLTELRADGRIEPRLVEIKRAGGTVEHQVRMGEAYRALVFRGIPVDLFIVRDPDTWGTIFALRTGPGDWNTRLVTDCKRFLRRVEGGQVYHSGQRIPCPEERDFFKALGQRWIEPAQRHVSKVRIEAVV